MVRTFVALFAVISVSHSAFADLSRIAISPDGTGFVRSDTKDPFVPWGVNYDHDRDGRLLEDYWIEEWDTVVEDFREIKELGANVVRIHLQTGQFMSSPTEANQLNLQQLKKLLALAEEVGLYLDVTGLGCYHKQDVPDWYDPMNEQERWAVHARFWEAITKCCHDSPVVFCYDLMNEPIVAGGNRQQDWLGPAFGGKHFVQRITLTQNDRPREQIALNWIEHLVEAIRRHDEYTLITVGLVPWSLDRPGLKSGFVPEKVCGPLDFVSVHLYPESDKPEAAMETLAGFDVGKPLVIEEIFPLKAGPEETMKFVLDSRVHADGWISFYWGKRLDEYDPQSSIPSAMIADWLRRFREHGPEMKQIEPTDSVR